MTSNQDPTSATVSSAWSSAAGIELSVDDVALTQPDPSSDPGIDGPTTPQDAAPEAPAPGPPRPPILAKRPVSGRYLSGATGFQLELRVDVDRTRPMKRVSGDFFQFIGATKTYFGSFVLNAPTITATPTLVTIAGMGTYTWPAAFPKVRVTIPRVSILQPQAPATLQFFNAANAPGATYLCRFQSIFFRTVQLETDRVSDVTTPVFNLYDTGSLPSPGPARTLSVVGAYAEAGIEVQVSAASDVVQSSEDGANATWSDAELHASMVKHFSLWQDVPQFKAWEVVAQLHDLGPSLLGIMFDQQGKQRQGCAVFHAGLGGITPDKLRLQLYTYVHELGHCFNLLHSWQKSLATPPGVDRPGAKSWMNYPWRYPGGPAAFWNDFPFQFDDAEILHLRHAYLNQVIMGGNDFAIGAGLSKADKFNRPLEDRSGLRLALSAPKSFALGEPVVVDLELSCTDIRGKAVHPYLNPADGLVSIAIRKPGGQVVHYEPMIAHCRAGDQVVLDAPTPIQESAYIGYGHDGLYFRQPGMYAIRAVYDALDGSPVVSNTCTLRVRSPVTAAEDEIADLMTGDEQGALFYLQGSDSEFLADGRKALDTVLEKHGKHPLAMYARLVKGINLRRQFKTISTEDAKVKVRPADHAESVKLLSVLTERTAEAPGIDRSTLDSVLARLAASQRAQNDLQGAAATEQRLRKPAPRAMARTYG